MNRRAMEVQTLIIVVLAVVFLLVMLGVAITVFGEGNIFSGPGNICEKTGGFIGGCS